MMDITVILVTYNSAEVIRGALESIPGGYPVIVVDNASVDDTCRLVEADFPHVRVEKLGKNIGFGCANNVGIKLSQTPFVMLMNPDARLIAPDTLTRLREKADEYPTAAIFSPSIIGEDGQRQMNLPAPILRRRQENKRFSMDMVAGDVCADALSGALMLLRKSSFEGRGYYFDPNMFLYFEDDDICMDANRRGYPTMLVPGIKVLHYAGQSSGSSIEVEMLKNEHRTCARLYLIGKYDGRLLAVGQAVKILLRNTISTMGYSLKGAVEKRAVAISRVRGVLLYLSGRFRHLTKLEHTIKP